MMKKIISDTLIGCIERINVQFAFTWAIITTCCFLLRPLKRVQFGKFMNKIILKPSTA